MAGVPLHTPKQQVSRRPIELVTDMNSLFHSIQELCMRVLERIPFRDSLVPLLTCTTHRNAKHGFGYIGSIIGSSLG